jgi:hypothetical protein
MSRMRRSRANNIGMHTIITVRQPSLLPRTKPTRFPSISSNNPYGGAQRRAARIEMGRSSISRKKEPTLKQKLAQKKLADEQREKNAPQRWIRNLDLDRPEVVVQDEVISDARYEAQVLPETRKRWEENRRRVEEWERKQQAKSARDECNKAMAQQLESEKERPFMDRFSEYRKRRFS